MLFSIKSAGGHIKKTKMATPTSTIFISLYLVLVVLLQYCFSDLVRTWSSQGFQLSRKHFARKTNETLGWKGVFTPLSESYNAIVSCLVKNSYQNKRFF